MKNLFLTLIIASTLSGCMAVQAGKAMYDMETKDCLNVGTIQAAFKKAEKKGYLPSQDDKEIMQLFSELQAEVSKHGFDVKQTSYKLDGTNTAYAQKGCQGQSVKISPELAKKLNS